MMKRWTPVVAFLAMALLAMQTAMSAEEPAGESVRGKIASVSDNQLTITDDAGKSHQVAFNATTKVTVDGQKATAKDLKAGQQVTAKVMKDDAGKLTASQIDAKAATEPE